MKSYLHLWRLQFPTGGIIRSLTYAENWIAVGNYNGMINTLDVRTGELLGTWKPNDFAPVQSSSWNESLFQLKATRRGNLVSSVGSGLLTLWKPAQARLMHHLRGQSSSTHCLEIIRDQLISVSSHGLLVVHNNFELNKDSTAIPTRIRNKDIRNVSSLTALQENHLMLLGSESGQIVLMA